MSFSITVQSITRISGQATVVCLGSDGQTYTYQMEADTNSIRASLQQTVDATNQGNQVENLVGVVFS